VGKKCLPGEILHNEGALGVQVALSLPKLGADYLEDGKIELKKTVKFVTI
jgi:hypothetical protein